MKQMLLFPDPRPLVERLGAEFFRSAPISPGVYLMRDSADTVLYVGKAKNLRKRLGSYRVANPDRMKRRHLRLVHAVVRIEFLICDTEESALARESELLKSIRPRFNRAGTWPAGQVRQRVAHPELPLVFVPVLVSLDKEPFRPHGTCEDYNCPLRGPGVNKPTQKREVKKSLVAPISDTPPPHGQEYGEECGGSGGVPYRFFAQAPDRITRVTVWHRQLVDGLQVETQKGPLGKIGGTGRHKDIHQDSFDLGPEEFITGVSVVFWTYLDRITFHTNKRDYGPFGGSGGIVKKTLHAPLGRPVVGFKGRHWDFVDSIQIII